MSTTYKSLISALLPPSTSAPVLQPSSHSRTTAPLPIHPKLTGQISALQLHPCLEAFLHILNADLAAAHFLLRHMEGSPYYEAMLLHAVLHRIEGDAENARAWYGDCVGSGIFEYVWAKEGEVDEGDLKRRVDEAKIEARVILAKRAGGKEQEQSNGDSDGTSSTAKHAPGSDSAKSISQTLPEAWSFLDRIHAHQLSYSKHRTESSWKEEHAALLRGSEREIKRISAWLECRFGVEKLEDASDEYPKQKDKKHADMASKQLVGGEGWRKF